MHKIRELHITFSINCRFLSYVHKTNNQTKKISLYCIWAPYYGHISVSRKKLAQTTTAAAVTAILTVKKYIRMYCTQLCTTHTL